MRRDNKKLLHLLYREINGANNLLYDICEGDPEKLERLHEDLPLVFLKLFEIRNYCDEKFDMFEESENWETEGYAEDFIEFIEEGLEDACACCDQRQIKPEILKQANCEEDTCINCIERGLGRKLTDDDYLPCSAKNNKLLN